MGNEARGINQNGLLQFFNCAIALTSEIEPNRSQAACDSRSRIDLQRFARLSGCLVETRKSYQEKAIPLMCGYVSRLEIDGDAKVLFPFRVVPFVAEVDHSQSGICLRESRIDLESAQSRCLGTRH